jgi:hypothetical protein
MESEHDPIDRWWDTTPEPKLELIEGQLIVGTPRGSQRMLWTLLQDYGPRIALPLAPADSWWSALREAFPARSIDHTAWDEAKPTITPKYRLCVKSAPVVCRALTVS